MSNAPRSSSRASRAKARRRGGARTARRETPPRRRGKRRGRRWRTGPRRAAADARDAETAKAKRKPPGSGTRGREGEAGVEAAAAAAEKTPGGARRGAAEARAAARRGEGPRRDGVHGRQGGCAKADHAPSPRDARSHRERRGGPRGVARVPSGGARRARRGGVGAGRATLRARTTRDRDGAVAPSRVGRARGCRPGATPRSAPPSSAG